VDHRNANLSLICRVQTRLYALPLTHVVETLRPLPVEPLAGAPDFVCGVCLIRGEPCPVIDAARLLGATAKATTTDGPSARFVTVLAGPHQVALAVDGVQGVRPVPPAVLRELPPLLKEASSEAVATIGRLDAHLLVVLRGGRLLPEALLHANVGALA
jgi:purine-binding chemotaxis protein CheW